jgi:Zn-dependent protease with chaperone function
MNESPAPAIATGSELAGVIAGLAVLAGFTIMAACIFWIVSRRFSHDGADHGDGGRKINVLLFPAETTLFLVLVVILSLVGMTRMLAFFPVLSGEFSRAVFWQYVSVEPLFSYLILLPFVLLAVIFYTVRPAYLIRKERLALLEEQEPELAARIRTLAGGIGLKRPVTAMVSPDRGGNVFVFGAYRQHYIGMDRGFIDTFREHDDEFAAVICHELAHIRSGDVDRTEIALAFLSSFLVSAALFLGMGIVTILKNFLRYGPDLGATTRSCDITGCHVISLIPGLMTFIPNFSMILVVVAIMGGVIAILLRFIVQYRELYADWMAARYLGEHESLSRALIRFHAAGLYGRGALGFFQQPEHHLLPRFHPPRKDRDEFLEDPGLFFSSWLALPFITGFAVAWFSSMIQDIGMAFGMPPGPESTLVPVFLPGVFLAAALLLPRLAGQELLGRRHRAWYQDPLVVVTVFMSGYAAGLYIIVNIGQLVEQMISQVLNPGTPSFVVQYIYTYSYLGMEFPAYHPGMALITSGMTAISVLAVLLVSLTMIRLLVQVSAVQQIALYPVASFLVLPGCFAAAVVLAALLGSPATALTLYLLALLTLVLMARRYHTCPRCAAPLKESFHPGISCPACGFDPAWWIKNPK